MQKSYQKTQYSHTLRTRHQVRKRAQNLMEGDVHLRQYKSLLTMEHVYTNTCLPARKTDGPHLHQAAGKLTVAVIHDDVSDWFYFVVFRTQVCVPDQMAHRTHQPTVLIEGVTQISPLDEGPIVVHYLQPGADKHIPVRYHLNVKTATTPIRFEFDLQELIDRFPNQVEPVADMICFVGDILAASSEGE